MSYTYTRTQFFGALVVVFFSKIELKYLFARRSLFIGHVNGGYIFFLMNRQNGSWVNRTSKNRVRIGMYAEKKRQRMVGLNE